MQDVGVNCFLPSSRPLASQSPYSCIGVGCLRVGTYRFNCRLKDDAILPRYKGSTFRGILGHALKRVVCALRHKECPSCLLKQRCIYARVFEYGDTSREHTPFVNAPPHPYLIEPPLETKTRYSAGEHFSFDLVLFGDYNEELPYFVYAFIELGEIGIGKRINEKSSRFELLSVTTNERTLYCCDDKILKLDNTTESFDISTELMNSNSEVSTLSVELVTPLRLKFENHLLAELPFHLLIRAAMRRISSLFAAYGPGEPELDYRGLAQRASEVECSSSELSWHDWKRYSNRSEQSMLMGGLTGRVTYTGELSEFLPLLKLAEKIHLGKQTTFGLGKIHLELSQ